MYIKYLDSLFKIIIGFKLLFGTLASNQLNIFSVGH